MERTIAPMELKKHLELGNPTTLIDVRRRQDYDGDPQMIPGAVWRDPAQVDRWSADMQQDREVIIYCVRGGSVSNAVLDHLHSKNLKARYIEGGITAWKEAVGLGTQGAG